MYDVVHVIDAGPIHFELVALGMPPAVPDAEAAEAACQRLRDAPSLTAGAEVEANQVWVTVTGPGVQMHVAVRLGPNAIYRAALAERHESDPEETPPCPQPPAPPGPETTGVGTTSSPPT